MEYKGYHAKIGYSEKDKLLVGEVIGINDSLFFHANSVEELEETFHQSVENYLQMCEEFGKKPDREYKGVFNVRLPSALHKEAVIQAGKRNQSLNDFVVSAVRGECKRAAQG